MATNPMQKKSRNAFILGVLVMFVITVLIVVLLYMKIKSQQEQIAKFQVQTQRVYVITQNVKSGDVLENGINYSIKEVQANAVPTGAITETTYSTVFSSFKFTDNKGRKIYLHLADSADQEQYYYLETPSNKLYRTISDNTTGKKEEVVSDNVNVNDKLYYKNDNGNNEITVTENAIVAKVNLNANTVLTSSLLSRADEITTDDLRKEEYNVISLPVDLAPEEYVDIRLMLPNGQNYIVLSKKKVSIPVVNGQYLSDTIQMNLTEEEILTMSCAIVENYQMEGSKLYATRYTEAGLQQAAYETYQPNDYVITLINHDRNIVDSAVKNLKSRNMKDIDTAVSNYGKQENVPSKTEESITSTQEQRKNYLLTLPVVQ